MENRNQPAFPPSKELCEYAKIEGYPFGLTKREYFAGVALQVIVNKYVASQSKEAVEHAIVLADELLKQLTQTH